jgi:serine/threonine protein phosphatase PrpC
MSLASQTAPAPRAQGSPPADPAVQTPRTALPTGYPTAPNGSGRTEAGPARTPVARAVVFDGPAAQATATGAQPTVPAARTQPDDGDYGLAPPVAEVPIAGSALADTDDYGLAPPTQATIPGQSATQAVPPPPGVADPRETLLTTEPDMQPESAATQAPPCVACGIGAVDGDGYCEHCGHAQPHRRDRMEQELARVCAVTDRGLRHHRNEDAFAVAETMLPDGTPASIAIVCDGVSSSSRPDEASETASVAASDTLRRALSSGTEARRAMQEALLAASESVNSLVEGDVSDPGTNAPACTFVSAITTGELLTVGWVGDSRAYWIPDDRTADNPARLTEDDSWAATMVEAGLLSEAEAYADERAHAITGWLGADAVGLDPHTACFEPDRPGIVVICSDGLWNYAESAAELAAIVPPDARARLMHCARTLVGVALDGGGHDNITVAVIPFPAPA